MEGGGARENNYRAITLTSELLKLYESVVLYRSKSEMSSSVSEEQGGFQDRPVLINDLAILS